jgi:hypothetical protein
MGANDNVSPPVHHGTTDAHTNRTMQHNSSPPLFHFIHMHMHRTYGSSYAALFVIPEYPAFSSIVLKESDATLMIYFSFE